MDELAKLRAHNPALASAVERVLLRDRPFVQAIMILVRRLLDGTASSEEELARGVLAWTEDGNRRGVEKGLRSRQEADFVLRGYLGISHEAMRRAKLRPSRWRDRSDEEEKDDLWRRKALEALIIVLRQRAWQSKDGFGMTVKDGSPYRCEDPESPPPAFPPGLFSYLGGAVREQTSRLVAREEIAADMWRRWRKLGHEEPISLSNCEDTIPVEWDPLADLIRREELSEGVAVINDLLDTGTERDHEVMRKLAVGEPVATSRAGKVALQSFQRKARLRREKLQNAMIGSRLRK